MHMPYCSIWNTAVIPSETTYIACQLRGSKWSLWTANFTFTLITSIVLHRTLTTCWDNGHYTKFQAALAPLRTTLLILVICCGGYHCFRLSFCLVTARDPCNLWSFQCSDKQDTLVVLLPMRSVVILIVISCCKPQSVWVSGGTPGFPSLAVLRVPPRCSRPALPDPNAHAYFFQISQYCSWPRLKYNIISGGSQPSRHGRLCSTVIDNSR